MLLRGFFLKLLTNTYVLSVVTSIAIFLYLYFSVRSRRMPALYPMTYTKSVFEYATNSSLGVFDKSTNITT